MYKYSILKWKRDRAASLIFNWIPKDFSKKVVYIVYIYVYTEKRENKARINTYTLSIERKKTYIFLLASLYTEGLIRPSGPKSRQLLLTASLNSLTHAYVFLASLLLRLFSSLSLILGLV